MFDAGIPVFPDWDTVTGEPLEIARQKSAASGMLPEAFVLTSSGIWVSELCNLCRKLHNTGSLTVHPYLDCELPEAFMPLSEPAEDFPWLDEKPSNPRTPQSQPQGHLFLGPMDTDLRVRLCIKSDLPFAPMHFTLPSDFTLLAETLASCNFQGVCDTAFFRDCLSKARANQDAARLDELFALIAFHDGQKCHKSLTHTAPPHQRR